MVNIKTGDGVSFAISAAPGAGYRGETGQAMKKGVEGEYQSHVYY